MQLAERFLGFISDAGFQDLMTICWWNYFFSVIVDKIDTNNDGFVDLSELKAWIQFTQRRYIEDDVQRQWRSHNPDNNDTIHWDVYRTNVYGFMEEMDPTDLEREDNGFSYKAMLTRDRRRWSVADRDGDDALTKAEFTDFLHPEESKYMRDVVVEETVEDIDKDDDGRISVEEYIGDMYRVTDDEADEPDWVKHERETFKTFRDKDGDGSLNNDEVKDWIIPQGKSRLIKELIGIEFLNTSFISILFSRLWSCGSRVEAFDLRSRCRFRREID